MRIGYISKPILGHAETHADCVAALNHTIAQCLALGHSAKEIQFPYQAETMQRAWGVISSTEVNTTLKLFAAQIGHKPKHGELELVTQIIAQLGQHHTAAEFTQALAVMKQSQQQIEALFSDVDIILTPVLARPPVEEGFFQPKPYEKVILDFLTYMPVSFVLNQLQKEMAKKVFSYVAFTPICNLSGHPAMSVPLYWNAQGLPIGSHFIGRWNDEATLLQLAAELEDAFPWGEKYKLLR